MSIEKRQHSRLYRRASAKFIVKDELYHGVLINFSEAGIFIETDIVFPAGTEITIPLKLKPEQETLMKGYVVWARKVADTSKSFLKSGLGIQLLAVPNEYLQFVRHCAEIAKKDDRTPENRFEIYHRVEIIDGERIHTEYTENISKSGMFLSTSLVYPEGSELSLRVEIHGLPKPIEVVGRVAYYLSEETALKSGRSQGLGIQFLDMDETSTSLWHFHIKRLETHRTNSSRKREEELPASGNLSEVSAPEILIQLLNKRYTGILILQRKAINKLVYFKNGHPVFVESNMYTETLGNFLFRRGVLTDKQMLDSLEVFSRSDLQYGELLIESELLSSSQLATSLVEHQEEKLANTFSWLEGTFELVEDQEWPRSITILPLRIYHIIFDGIVRWYDPNILSTWMGLDEFISVKANFVQLQGQIVPPIVQKFMLLARNAESISNLAKKIKLPNERIIQMAYGLVVLGWLGFDYSKTETPTENVAPQVSPVPQNELLFVIKRWVDDDFEKLKNLSLYELLGIDENADEQEITKAYLYQYSRYNSHELEQISYPDLEEKLSQIRSWIRLSYDILKDPNLSSLYKNRTSKTKANGANSNLKAKRIEAERILLESMKAIELGNYSQAHKKLAKAVSDFPDYHILAGYLGWCLFQINPKDNRKQAVELIDRTLEKEDQDPLLHYYRGEIYFLQGQWQSAEYHFSQAMRLKSGFIKAQVACEVAKEKRIHANKTIQFVG